MNIKDILWLVFMDLFVSAIIGGLVYMVGYNSGFNNGYQTAIKNDPMCKKDDIVHIMPEGQ